MDGTLVDTEAVIATCIADWLRGRGYIMSDEQRQFVIGRAWSDIWDKLAVELEIPFSRNDAELGIMEEKDRVIDREGLRILPGAVEAVQGLAQEWPLTIVSGSTRREIEDIITRLDLAAEIPSYIGCEDYGPGKPAPDAYLIGAKLMRSDPARCLVFEDSWAGVASAKAAGAVCVAVEVGNFAGQDQSAADVVIETLKGVDVDWVQALAAKTLEPQA